MLCSPEPRRVLRSITGRTFHPSRPTSNTPPRAMAVEDMRSDCPNSEPARNWAACAGHPQGHRRPVSVTLTV